MTPVPTRLTTLLDEAFLDIQEYDGWPNLHELAEKLYAQAYHDRLQYRTPADNRPEHELIVLRTTMRICFRSGHERASKNPFTREEMRVAVATALLHDLRFIPRITEEMIQAAEAVGLPEKAKELSQARANQRRGHMRGSAEDALQILRTSSLLTKAEIRQCIGYIGLHDTWKLGWPYPASSDWLAVCCLEGDALWPLDRDHGPHADLERKAWQEWLAKCPESERPTWVLPDLTHNDLKKQAESNLKLQLCAYRESFACSAEVFQDSETIIRTTEGAVILNELRAHWGI